MGGPPRRPIPNFPLRSLGGPTPAGRTPPPAGPRGQGPTPSPAVNTTPLLGRRPRAALHPGAPGRVVTHDGPRGRRRRGDLGCRSRRPAEATPPAPASCCTWRRWLLAPVCWGGAAGASDARLGQRAQARGGPAAGRPRAPSRQPRRGLSAAPTGGPRCGPPAGRHWRPGRRTRVCLQRARRGAPGQRKAALATRPGGHGLAPGGRGRRAQAPLRGHGCRGRPHC